MVPHRLARSSTIACPSSIAGEVDLEVGLHGLMDRVREMGAEGGHQEPLDHEVRCLLRVEPPALQVVEHPGVNWC